MIAGPVRDPATPLVDIERADLRMRPTEDRELVSAH
jgi:hypothetical protein